MFAAPFHLSKASGCAWQVVGYHDMMKQTRAVQDHYTAVIRWCLVPGISAYPHNPHNPHTDLSNHYTAVIRRRRRGLSESRRCARLGRQSRSLPRRPRPQMAPDPIRDRILRVLGRFARGVEKAPLYVFEGSPATSESSPTARRGGRRFLTTSVESLEANKQVGPGERGLRRSGLCGGPAWGCTPGPGSAAARGPAVRVRGFDSERHCRLFDSLSAAELAV
jgi:hypothetical protein